MKIKPRIINALEVRRKGRWSCASSNGPLSDYRRFLRQTRVSDRKKWRLVQYRITTKVIQ